MNGIENPASRQTNSRIGLTGSIPLTRHQSIKFSYKTGSYIRFGGDYLNLSIAWQNSWIDRPN